jgi:hypothetical protein
MGAADDEDEQSAVELWSGTRRVQRLSLKDNGQAVTHEVNEGRLVPKGKE